MTTIPDNARPTTPCDQPLEVVRALLMAHAHVAAPRQRQFPETLCGNTWGVRWGGEADGFEDAACCTSCGHVCNHDRGSPPEGQPFRFLTGPEIEARIIEFEPALAVLAAIEPWVTILDKSNPHGHARAPEAQNLYLAAKAYLAVLESAKPLVRNITLDPDRQQARIWLTDDDSVLVDLSDPYHPTVLERTP